MVSSFNSALTQDGSCKEIGIPVFTDTAVLITENSPYDNITSYDIILKQAPRELGGFLGLVKFTNTHLSVSYITGISIQKTNIRYHLFSTVIRKFFGHIKMYKFTFIGRSIIYCRYLVSS